MSPASGDTPVTFALNVGETVPTSATGYRLVVVPVVDADAAGNESHTMAAGARAKPATSTARPRRKVWRGLIRTFMG